MRKRRRALLAAACLLAAVALVALLLRETEPQYQGRSLSQWLESSTPRRPGDPTVAEAREALHHLGTNAFPTLLQWISHDPSTFRKTTLALSRKLPGPVQFRFLHAAADRANKAQMALAILGPEARPTIPELTRLAVTSRGDERALRCINSLQYMGPEALPGLITVITNKGGMVRYYAISCIPRFGTNALPALPILIRALGDQDDVVACEAADALGELALSPSNAAPALVDMLQSTEPVRRTAAARALGGFGPAAGLAAPALRRILADPDQGARDEAKKALLKIAPDTLTNAPS